MDYIPEIILVQSDSHTLPAYSLPQIHKDDTRFDYNSIFSLSLYLFAFHLRLLGLGSELFTPLDDPDIPIPLDDSNTQCVAPELDAPTPKVAKFTDLDDYLPSTSDITSCNALVDFIPKKELITFLEPRVRLPISPNSYSATFSVRQELDSSQSQDVIYATLPQLGDSTQAAVRDLVSTLNPITTVDLAPLTSKDHDDIEARNPHTNNLYPPTSEHPNFRESTGNPASASPSNHSTCNFTQRSATLNLRTGVPNISDNPILEFNADRDLVRSLEYNPEMDYFAQSSDRPRGPKVELTHPVRATAGGRRSETTRRLGNWQGIQSESITR